MFRINANIKKEKQIQTHIETVQNKLETIQNIIDSEEKEKVVEKVVEKEVEKEKEKEKEKVVEKEIINQRCILVNPCRRIYVEERDMLTFFCQGFLKSIIIHGDFKGNCEWKLIRKDTNECISSIKTSVNTFEWTDFSNIPSSLTAMEIIGKCQKESKLIAIEINF